MSDRVREIVRLLIPIWFAIVAGLLIWTKLLSLTGIYALDLGPVAIQPVLDGEIELQIGLTLVVLLMMFLGLWFRNYAAFFPGHLAFRVQFDTEGLQSACDAFPGRYQSTLNIADNWQEKQATYMRQYNDRLRKLAGSRTVITDRTIGSGRLHFQYTKKRWRLHAYKIHDGEGYVDLDTGRAEAIKIHFGLMDTSDSDIMPSLVEMLFYWTVVIKPVFNQYYFKKNLEKDTIENLTSCTTLRFFPWISISDTVYFVRCELTNVPDGRHSEEQLVPIAYGRYE